MPGFSDVVADEAKNAGGDLIFWNVDTQYDFMRRTGSLYVSGAESIEPNLERLTELARRYGVRVVNTADLHDGGSAEISNEPDFVNTFPKHCIRGTEGAGYVPATGPGGAYSVDWKDRSVDMEKISNSRNIIIYKDAFDVFAGNPYTESVLAAIGPDIAVVYGVATNVCVDYAARGLLERGVSVRVVWDAIKELPNLPLEETVREWERLGAALITTDQIENELLRRCR